MSAERVVTALILVPMFGSGVWSVGSDALPAVLRATQERGFSPEVLALSLGLLLAGLWVQILYFAGPIAASAAQVQWLAVEEVLGHERMLTWLVAAVAIALLVTLAALVARAMGWPIPAVAVSTALGFTALLVVTLWLQKHDLPAGLGTVFLIAALVLATAQAWSSPVGLAVGLGAAAAVGRPPVRAFRRHSIVPRWQLVRAHTNRWSVHAGLLSMDGDIIQAVQESRGPSMRRALPALWYRGPAALSVIVFWRAVSGALVPAAALVLTALTADRLLGPGAAFVVFLVLQYRLAMATGRTAEDWLRSPALQRIWGSAGRQLFAPVLLASLLVTALALLITSSPAALVVLLVTGPLILWRRDRARRDEGLTLVATPAGPLPLQTVNRTIAGYDVLAIAALAALGL